MNAEKQKKLEAAGAALARAQALHLEALAVAVRAETVYYSARLAQQAEILAGRMSLDGESRVCAAFAARMQSRYLGKEAHNTVMDADRDWTIALGNLTAPEPADRERDEAYAWADALGGPGAATTLLVRALNSEPAPASPMEWTHDKDGWRLAWTDTQGERQEARFFALAGDVPPLVALRRALNARLAPDGGDTPEREAAARVWAGEMGWFELPFKDGRASEWGHPANGVMVMRIAADRWRAHTAGVHSTWAAAILAHKAVWQLENGAPARVEWWADNESENGWYGVYECRADGEHGRTVAAADSREAADKLVADHNRNLPREAP